MRGRGIAIVLMAVWTAAAAVAQTNRVDVVSPLAPELAGYGDHAIGVRTVRVTAVNRPDVLAAAEAQPVTRRDRTLTLEIWYPAMLRPDQAPGGTYRTPLRDPDVVATLHGRAVRDAAPLTTGPAHPLVIVSHGYPGNRYLLAHLCENLASKGYVVASVDHPDSTYDDQKAFASTLYNRPLDQLFVLDEIARLAHPGSGSFMSGIVDPGRTAIVGYSMGGYGALNAAGAGFSRAAETMENAPPNGMLAERGAAAAGFAASIDARIKAVVAIAPWGMARGVWDAEGLRGIRIPLLLVGGTADEVAGYAKGARAIYEQAVNAERYLLTFVNAGHNAGAPIPAPAEAYAYSTRLKAYPFLHYADAVWDTVRMNNILNHFATAFLGRYVKGDPASAAYLDVVPHGKDAVFSVDEKGVPTPAHTYWKGFKRGTAVGLAFERLPPAHD